MKTIIQRPQVRTLIVFSLLIMLTFCGVIIFQAKQSYDGIIKESEQQSQQLAQIVADHAELTFLAVDLTLRRVIERNYFNYLFGGTIPQDLMHNVRKWVNETPQIAAIMVIDEAGKGLLGAHKAGYKNWVDYQSMNFSNNEFFQTLRQTPDRFFWISKLEKRANFDKELIIVSRRITTLDGEFGGLVLAAIEPDYFEKFFRSIQNYPASEMSLFLEDGTALQGALPEGFTNDSSRSLSEDFFETVKTADKVEIFANHPLRKLPLSVIVSLHEDDFLASWWEMRRKDFAFLAVFLIFSSILSFFAIATARQIARVEKSEAAAVLASQAKSEFLANMSHELRTPLNAIIGFSEMLNSGYFGPLNPKQKERINDINLCGSHLLQLITDILEFSKGEAGKLELNEEKVDLTRIVNETLRIMNEKIRSKEIQVNVDIEKELPRMWGDKRKIRQMLLNLLSNSVKFTPEGGAVKVSLRLDSSRNISMVVTDTGIGIPESKIATALSVFGQVHRDQSHEGTGLGLPLCRMFAELHGGKMAIGSSVGEGTTVRVTFPRQRAIFDEVEASYYPQENPLLSGQPAEVSAS